MGSKPYPSTATLTEANLQVGEREGMGQPGIGVRNTRHDPGWPPKVAPGSLHTQCPQVLVFSMVFNKEQVKYWLTAFLTVNGRSVKVGKHMPLGQIVPTRPATLPWLRGRFSAPATLLIT